MSQNRPQNRPQNGPNVNPIKTVNYNDVRQKKGSQNGLQNGPQNEPPNGPRNGPRNAPNNKNVQNGPQNARKNNGPQNARKNNGPQSAQKNNGQETLHRTNLQSSGENEVTFAYKLATFMLNRVDSENISLNPITDHVSSLLPFLYMNISAEDFINMSKLSIEQMTTFLAQTCDQNNPQSSCRSYANKAAETLSKCLFDTIVSGYSERTLGQKNTSIIAEEMKNLGNPNDVQWC
jgi:hypothetical protein